MNRRILSIIICVVLSCGCLVGCADSSLFKPLLAEEEPEEVEEEEETMEAEETIEEAEVEEEEPEESTEDSDESDESDEDEEDGEEKSEEEKSESEIDEAILAKMRENYEKSLQEESQLATNDNFLFEEDCTHITKFELNDNILTVETESGISFRYPMIENCPLDVTYYGEIYDTWVFEDLIDRIESERQVWVEYQNFESPTRLCIEIEGSKIVRIYTINS